MHSRTAIPTWVLLLLSLSATSVVGQAPAGPRYVVIVQHDSPVTGVERQFLEDAFLKRVTRWPGNGSIHPVDLAPTSPVRRMFSEQVLGRSVDEVRAYWQQRIFSGRDLPPAELDTDEQVVIYVASHPGAVGYVSATADLKGARPVALR
jgi:ABC-type phosphate transport system substrate-binding protein